VDYGEVGRYSGVDAITDLMSQLHNGMGPTYHRLTNFTISVDGDRATARSYVHAVLQAIPDDPASWVEALGHYDDELVRTPEGWRIARRTTGIARVHAGAPSGS
jgi:SnoaL-like domain